MRAGREKFTRLRFCESVKSLDASYPFQTVYVDGKAISIMLFVGAGASKPFGTPVLSELTRDVKRIIDRAGYEDLWGHVYDNLKETSKQYDGYFTSDDEIDMEVVLSVIDFLVDPVQKTVELGPSLLYSSPKDLSEHFKGRMPSKEEYSNIRNEIENKIVDSCRNIDFQFAKEYYRKLFKLEESIQRIPDLELYIINVFSPKESGVTNETDFRLEDIDEIRDRKMDITLSGGYDAKTDELFTDHLNLIERLISLGENDEVISERINKILEEYTPRHFSTEKVRTNFDILISKFKIVRVVQVQRRDDSDSISGKLGDFTSETLNKWIQEGYQDAIKQ